jgi:type IV pilus assembly protein PilN
VILVNLLPHREAARKRRRDSFYGSLGLAALVGGILAGAIFLWFDAQISSQQNKNALLENEIKRLEGQIKDITTLQAEIASLKARQQAVEDLQADRNLPVHLLNELVRQLPDGVYITSTKQENQLVSIVGVAQSNERVSELLRNLSYSSEWLRKPELIEIVAITIPLSQREQRRVSKFEIKVQLIRASEAKKAASSASEAAVPAAVASAAKT